MSDTPFEDILWEPAKTEDQLARESARDDLLALAEQVARARGPRLAWVASEIRALKENLERVPQFSKRRDV